jgi:acetyl esterase/lipase
LKNRVLGWQLYCRQYRFVSGLLAVGHGWKRANMITALKSLLLLSVSLLAADCLQAAEPAVEQLWPNGAPGALGNEPKDKPTLTIYLPEAEKANGAAVAICPGGSYMALAMDHEGHRIGQWLNSLGVAGFVVDYRHRGKGYGHPAPLDDLQRAVRTIRARSGPWKIDPKRVGVMGFSAGGHLASTAATHFDAGDPAAANPIDRQSCRPDFAILCYALIAFEEPYTSRIHLSETNLLGKTPDPRLVRSLSNEKQVTAETPPTFLFQTDEDNVVQAEHSVNFYLALRRAGVPAEMHIYRTGKHGLGLAESVPGTRNWPVDCEAWMRGLGLLDRQKKQNPSANFTEAIHLNPKFAMAYHYRGVGYSKMGNNSKAETDFAEAKRLGFED